MNELKWLLPILLFALSAGAQDLPVDGRVQWSVQWLEPKIVANEKDKSQGEAEVTLSGRARPGLEIVINGKSIAVLLSGLSADESVKLLARENVVIDAEPFSVDREGIFEIRLRLPFGIAQVPLVIREPGTAGRSFQISLEVTRQGVLIQDMQRQREYVKRHQIWFGLGLNTLTYTQASPQINSNLTFESLKYPSLFLEGRYLFSRSWQALGFANVAPGAADSSDNVSVSNGSYKWTIFGAEAMWLPEKLEGRLFGRATITGFRAGIQRHSIPYLSRLSATEVEMKNAPLTMATLGLRYYVQASKTWGIESFFRYQHPIVSGPEFVVTPSFAFDGSFGVLRTVRGHWTWGAFWYGQMQKYKYSTFDRLLGDQVGGTQSVLFSSVELRGAYIFN